ncbi:phage tail tape measure protein [Lentisphaerota bacterium WC36G]|nr:phage tail tape measure protein [Lentisphaerae bacterium WC36]
MSASNIRAGRAYVEIAANDSKLSKDLRNAQAKLRNFAASVQSIGREMLIFGAMVGTPFVLATKHFANFDDNMRLVQAVTKATGAEFEKLSRRAKVLGRTTSFTAQQVAAAMVALGRMGFSGDEITNSIEHVLNLARATGTDLAEASDIAANSMRIFKIEAQDMSKVTDILTVTANGSSQTLTDLFESLKMAGPQASAAGENIRDVAAAIGTLANFGIKGSIAGTALRKAYMNFAKVSIQKKLRTIGVETLDSNKNLRKMADIFRDLSHAMSNMKTAEKISFAEDIFDVRGSLAGLTLAENNEQLENFFKKLRTINGEAERTAKNMDAGIGGSLRLAYSALEGFGNKFSEIVSNYSGSEFIDSIKNSLTAATEFINNNQHLVAVLTQGAAAFALFGAVALSTGGAVKITHGVINVLSTTLQIASKNISLVTNKFAVNSKFLQAMSSNYSTLIDNIKRLADLKAAQKIPGGNFSGIGGFAKKQKIIKSNILAQKRLTKITEQYLKLWHLAPNSKVNQWALKMLLLDNNQRKLLNSTKSFSLAQNTAMVKAKLANLATATSNRLATFGITLKNALSLATVRHTVATAASSGATLTLNLAQKSLAVSTLAVSGAFSAVCAHPIAATFVAVTAVIGLLAYKMGQLNIEATEFNDHMQKLHEKAQNDRKDDSFKYQRVLQVASNGNVFDSKTIKETAKALDELQQKYGDIGIAFDQTTKKFTVRNGSENIFVNKQLAMAKHANNKAIEELKIQYSQAHDEIKAISKGSWLRQNLGFGIYDKISADDMARLKELQGKVNEVSSKLQKLQKEQKILNSNNGADLGKKKALIAGQDAKSNEQLFAEEQETLRKANEEVKKHAKEKAKIVENMRRAQLSEHQKRIDDLTKLYRKEQEIIKKSVSLAQQKMNLAAKKQDFNSYHAANKELINAKNLQTSHAALYVKNKQKAETEYQKKLQKTAEEQRKLTAMEKERKRSIVEQAQNDYNLMEKNRQENQYREQLNAKIKLFVDNGKLTSARDMINKLLQSVTKKTAQLDKAWQKAVKDNSGATDDQKKIDKAKAEYYQSNSKKDYLKRTLASLMQQTQKKVQDVVAPAGSTSVAQLKILAAGAGSNLQKKIADTNSEIANNTKKILQQNRKNALKFGGK